MAVSSTTSTALANSTTTATNPNGILGKDDFMKLLLTELQYQDPTDPMDSDKILSQTSQLASLESQENTNKVMQEVANNFANTQNFQAVAAIGRLADLGSENIAYSGNSDIQFDMFYPSAIEEGTLLIKDSSGSLVRSIALDQSSAGIQTFQWDGKDADGNSLESGNYKIESNYRDASGVNHEAKYGVYPVSAVSFDNGDVQLKLGSNYINLGQVKEIF